MQKKALGRGLETLIPTAPRSGAREERSEIVEIPLQALSANPYQPRRSFGDQALQELADSVKLKGIIQPVLVRRLGDGRYELIAGERRYRAARLAGLHKIPAVVRPVTDAESMEMALIENLQRKDLNAMEAARAYQRLMKEFGLTQDEMAGRLGKDRSSIANTVRLTSLHAEIQTWVEEEQLSLGHAKVLVAIKDPDRQVTLARQAVKGGLSVRELERIANKASRPRTHLPQTAHATALEDRLKRRFGTQVVLMQGKVGGKIVLSYYSSEDLERILDLLLGQ
ncbi:MAG: ParB/RepB/Spo0J family partition protein [Nitrospirae bacterium]|nr:MAG: ParB/RepB/Spo0J family partition protein [Nitrospirota bacterium]